MSLAPDILLQWEVIKFYHMVRFHSWEAHSQNEYSKLMAIKAGAK